MRTYLDFEKPVAELESQVAELRSIQEADNEVSVAEEIARLEEKALNTLQETYEALLPWQKTQVARHPDRPHFSDFIKRLITEFTPLSGDRLFAEDHALIGGIGRFRGRPVMLLGHEKGRTTEARLKHNFGMPRPEGYRKAVRMMRMADKFDMPVITFVDTAGAYPGVGAEERGQAEAIARSTDCCLSLKVPLITVITGEGGSGGAIAIASANRVLMLEHAIYTVASPEAAASILWHDSSRAEDAATNMKITAEDLKKFGIIDGIIPEPIGGAHRDPEKVIDRTGRAIGAALADFQLMDGDKIRALRHSKFLSIGKNLQ